MADVNRSSVMIATGMKRRSTDGLCRKVPRAWYEVMLFGYGADMSLHPAESPVPARKTPAKTLDDVVYVMTGDVDADFKQQFQGALHKAWATARAESSLEPLTNLVENWWPIARRWSDPVAARAYYAELDKVVREGIPAESRGNALRSVAELRAKHGPHPAFDKLESLTARW